MVRVSLSPLNPLIVEHMTVIFDVRVRVRGIYLCYVKLYIGGLMALRNERTLHIDAAEPKEITISALSLSLSLILYVLIASFLMNAIVPRISMSEVARDL